MPRAMLMATLTAATVALLTGSASAHARLLRSSPANGATVDGDVRSVSVSFDDVIRLVPRALVVTGATGAPLATAAPRIVARRTLEVTLLDRLVPGRYFVGWRILSDDGHVETGSFGFAVGAAGAPAAPAPSAAVPAPTQPTWPVLVAAGLAVVAGLGAGLVVHRGLRAVGVALEPYAGSEQRAESRPDQHAASQPRRAASRH